MRRISKLLNLTMIGLVFTLSGTVGATATPFVPFDQPIGWLERPAVSNFDTSSGTEVLFRGGYRTLTWSGDITAYRLKADGTIDTTVRPWGFIAPNRPNTAATRLSAVDPDDRKIVTFSDGVGVPFRWASLSDDQRDWLQGRDEEGRQDEIVRYLRGDRSQEVPIGDFRQRDFVLGNVIRSSLLYWKHENGAERLYFGANDGMLHVLDASDGTPVFSYVPSMLIPNLKALTETAGARLPFVDGPMTMALVDDGGTVRTILVGALGAGGQGLFALDVSEPSPASESAAAAQILWEISAQDADFEGLGYAFAAPRIARLQDGTLVAIVGNGYFGGAEGVSGRGSFESALFVIDLIRGDLIREIRTGREGGLSSPTVVLDENNRVKQVYAGDINGRLWRFDPNMNNSATLLFETRDGQAITVAPVARPHPDSAGGYLVAFGTGRMLTPDDQEDEAVHYVYGIWDRPGAAPIEDSRLLAQALRESTERPNGWRLRTLSSNEPDWGTHRGWRVALPAGERVLGTVGSFYNEGRFVFISTNPTIPSPAPGVPPGENWQNEFEFLTGGAPASPFIALHSDSEFDARDLVDADAEGNNGLVPVARFEDRGVMSQPVLVAGELLNYTVMNWHDNMLPFEIVLPTESGVAGGHFDYDIFRQDPRRLSDPPDRRRYQRVRHRHEYDVRFNVTGVNKLNPSHRDYLLENIVADPDMEFRILVMNQSLNPAAQIKLGDMEGFESVIRWGGQAGPLAGGHADAATMLADQPVFTRNNIQNFVFNMPINGFEVRNWWERNGGDLGTGEARAGLMPTQTGCANRVANDGRHEPRRGAESPNGERFNGALTFQLIRAETPHTALELNNTNQALPLNVRMRDGWRVRQDEFNTWVLGEYMGFWHHPNKHCYGQDNWVPDPPPDLSNVGKRPNTPPAGTDDPRFGGLIGGDDVRSVETTTANGVTTTVVTYGDGKTWEIRVTQLADGRTEVWQKLRDGTEILTITPDGLSPGEARQGPPTQRGAGLGPLGPAGRQSWRELRP